MTCESFDVHAKTLILMYLFNLFIYYLFFAISLLGVIFMVCIVYSSSVQILLADRETKIESLKDLVACLTFSLTVGPKPLYHI